MFYVYLIRSRSFPKQRYVGIASDLKRRLAEHNAGESPHTLKCAPWELVTHLAFSTERRAVLFEKYLKSGSGQAFATKRLW